MKNGKIASSIGLAIMAPACASIPDVTANYYLPRADLTLTVTRTVGCGKRTEGNVTHRTLHSVATVAHDIRYSADTSQAYALPFARGGGIFADEGMALEFHEDGRLKGINATSTGRGGEVIQGIAGLLPFALASNAVGPNVSASDRAFVDQACRAIDEAVGEGKTISMIHEVTEDFLPSGAGDARRVAQPRWLPLAARGSSASEAVQAHLPQICVAFRPVDAADSLRAPAVWNGNRTRLSTLTLRRPARYQATVFQYVPQTGETPSDATCREVGQARRMPLWSATLHVPLTREASAIVFNGNDGHYAIPVPASAAFGGSQMTLALADSGAVTKLQYGSTSGAASALAATRSVADVIDTSTAERLAEVRGQADLIQQQQRLVRCQADPASC